jgi:predicted O-methyltransferase YrrM
MPAPTAAALDRIPGWFWPADQRLFAWFLSAGTPGDLLELGTYLGKSAVLIGGHLRPARSAGPADTSLAAKPPSRHRTV